ncbi:MAG: hypothetical protein ACD_67C00178G0001, partial [uncultured bacterium]
MQKRAEEKLIPLIQEVVATDFPCFGICYGLEIITKSLDTELTHDFQEKAGAIDLHMTENAKHDALLADLP